MPSGRKSRQKVKGGGFGSSLQPRRETAGINFQKPDPTRLRLNGETEHEVTVMDFVATDKAKVSCLQAKDLDDYFAQTLANQRTYEEQRNLVLLGKDAVSNGPARLVRPAAQTGGGLFGGQTGGLFATKPELPLPQRPFAFRDPAGRVLDFATFFGRRLVNPSEPLTVSAEQAFRAVGECSDPAALIASLDAYFRRRENFAPLMSAKDLEAEELAAFARWRHQISQIEQTYPDIVITPYEKNPEYWKQLWRTIERSDCVIEIVDARNPLLFRCKSFEAMVRRANKPVILLMNKTDFLSNGQRKAWRTYFEKNNLEIIFYSAMRELTRQQNDPQLKLSKQVLESLDSHINDNNDHGQSDHNHRDSDCGDNCHRDNDNDVKYVTRKLDAFAALAEEEGEEMDSTEIQSIRKVSDESEEAVQVEMEEVSPTYLSLVNMDEEDCVNCDELLETLESRGRDLVAKKSARYALALAIYQHLETLVNEIPNDKRVELYTNLSKFVLDTLYPLTPQDTSQGHEEEEEEESDESDETDSDSDETDSDSDSDSDNSDSDNNEKDSEKDSSESEAKSESESESESEPLIQHDLSHTIEMNKETRKKLVESFLSVFLGPKQSLEVSGVDEGLPESAVENFLRPVIGTCGFPNVGKSSLINTLLKGTKRVAVSRTPGKTRHLQTILVPNSILTLCDCPGLVFPTVAKAKEDLVLNNSASVDIFRGTLVPVVALMLKRVSDQIAEVYGVQKQFEKMTQLTYQPIHELARDAIAEVAYSRKFIASGRGGIPDIERTCRMLIKAYCQGQVIAYCERCPDTDTKWWQSEEDQKWNKRRQVLRST